MKIGETLVKQGLITLEQLESALQEQSKTRERLGDILTRMGFLDTGKLALFLAAYFELPFLQLRDVYKEISPSAVKLIPQDLAVRFNILPVKVQDNKLILAMSDPLDVVALDTVKLMTGYKVMPSVCDIHEISEAIEYCYNQLPRMDEHIEDFIKLEASNGYEETDSEKMRVEANDPPVVQYVNSLIVQAVNDSASDIHVQPKQESVDLQLRIDGTLYSINSPPKSMLSAIVTRIKIMAHLDIAEHRLPQDGRFKLKVGSSEIDLRVSCFPTIYGESVVMRILNTSSPLNGLEQLGFSAYDLGRFRELIRNAYGLILVTGPTGSGKTTTLYTAINEIKSSDKNIITLEDPVEYRMQDIQQSQVNPGIGFSFARGLRSILRQDPDVIMVGEIRDKETAEIAIHAALTGHLVFSTLHTNDAAGATVRMVNMGVEPFLITSSLLGVLAQRLVRCTCQACKREYVVDKKILEKLSLTPDVAKFYRGEGCKKCLKSGYKGRSGIFELLIPDESMRNLILNRASGEMIKHSARENGMKTLRESGIEKIKSGLTTPEEVLRVTQETGTD